MIRSLASWALAGTRLASDAALRLRSDWVVPVNQPLLLISQIQRSGGTLLARLLDDHPECFTHPYELSWGRPKKADWPRLDLRRSTDSVLRALDEPWIGNAIRAHGYAKGKLVAEMHPFIFDRRLQRRLFRRLLPSPHTGSQRDALDAYLTAFFNAWLDYQNLYRGAKRFVAAFTPRVTMLAASLAGFWDDYPDGHLISIVRDPVDWYASARRHHAEYADIERALGLWQSSAEHALGAHDLRPEQVTIVLFRDLVENTAEAMDYICSAVGLASAPSLLTPTYNGRPALSNSSFQPHVGVDPAAADRTASLTRDELVRVRAIGGALYADVSSRFSLSTLHADREARRRRA